MTLAELDQSYYRIAKSWPSLSRRDGMLVIAELSQLEDRAAELGAIGRKLTADIKTLKAQVTQSLAE